MNILGSIIFPLLRHSAFVVILFSVMLGPCIPTLSLLSDTNFKLVQIDIEEDLDTEEKEGEHKEPKVQLYNDYQYCQKYTTGYHMYITKTLLYRDFYKEILIPPPDTTTVSVV